MNENENEVERIQIMLTSYLNSLPLKEFTGNIFRFSLVDLAVLAGFEINRPTKSELVKILNAYLANPANIRRIWEGLPAFDQEFVQDIIVNKGYMNQENLARLAKQYKRQKINVTYYDPYHTKSGYFNKDSKVALFFIDGMIPEYISDILKEYRKEPHYRFTEVKVSSRDLEGLSLFKMSDELEKDLVSFVRLVGTGKIKVTQSNKELTKASLKRMNEYLVHQEYETEFYGIDTIKRGQDSMRVYGLYQMLLDADVIDIEGTSVVLGTDTNEFLSECFTKKIERLYKAYLYTAYMQESERIKERKFDLGYPTHMELVRAKIMKFIAKAPVDQWIDIEVLSEDLFKNDRLFLREHIAHVAVIPRTNGYPVMYEPIWEQLERRIIDVMLIEYLHPLGIVDVALEDDEVEREFDMKEEQIVVAKYFKLTKLGAYILGVRSEYEDPSLKGQVANALWVDEALCIVISQSVKRYQHEIFFDRIGERIEKEDATCYAINFQMAIKAQGEGISLDGIFRYLEKESTQPLPSILKEVFEHWKKDQKKIRIRQVTIIECDDPELTRELLSMNGITKHMVKSLEPTIEIKADAAQKVKKELERQSYFCEIQ